MILHKTIGLYSLFIVNVLYALELEPIVIQSAKMDESSLEIPHTVNVISSAQIETQNIDTIQKLSAVFPNTNISGLGTRSETTFTVRGISNYVAIESSVAMYIDDVPLPMSYGFGTVDMNNVDTIEMFKGPQGTLFGKNAESGVINIYTKPISKNLESEARLGIAEYDSRELYGRISGPTVVDKVWGSLALTKKTTDGYATNTITHNPFDHRDLAGLSMKLNYIPSNYFNIALNYTKSKVNDGGTPFKIDTKNDPYHIDNEPKDDSVIMNNDLLSLVVKAIQNDYSITSATAYSNQSIQKQDYVAILGGLDLGVDINIKEISQELRLNGTKKDFDYVIGAFYSDKLKFNYKEKQVFTALPAYNNSNILDNIDQNIALFSQVKYTISDYLVLNGGIRYQQTNRDFCRDYSGFSAPISATLTSHDWLPMVSLSYGTDDFNTYLTYTKGYRPSGYNYRSSGTTLVPYMSEVTQSYELGYKQFFGSSWNMSHALFYNDISNLRTIVFDNTLATQTKNANSAYSYGVESSLNYSVDNLDVYGSFGLIRARYETFISNGIDYSGKNLIDVPDMTLSMGGHYRFDPHWYAKTSFTYMGKRYYDVDNTKHEDGYTTCNGGFGYKDKKWTMEVYANNLFGSENVDFMIHTPSHDYYHFAPPRVVGIRLEIML